MAPTSSTIRPTSTRVDASDELCTTIVPIAGMTCRACELRLGRALRRVHGVVDASASVRRAQAEVRSRGPLDDDAARAAVERAGYIVGVPRRPWFSRDRAVWHDVLVTAAIIAVIAVAWWMFGLDRIGGALSGAASSGNLVFVVLLGVAASLSTCMALVGGIVMSLSAQYAERHPGATRWQRMRPQFAFNLGRIVGFSLLGAAVGALGGLFALQGPALGILLIVVAAVMGMLGLRLSGLSPRLAAFTFTLPPVFSSWMFRNGATEPSSATAHSRGGGRAMLLGAASFFLPCGFTQAVQVYALSTGSATQAAIVMGLFAVGTTPGLLAAGAASALARGATAKRAFRVIGVVVVAFALVNLSGGLSLLGVGPATASSGPTAERTSNVTDADGVQVAAVTVGSTGYSPATTVVYAGTPVRWVLSSDAYGCASIIDASALGVDDQVMAAEGETTVEFTPPKPGTYRYQCAMGMYQGEFTVVEPPAKVASEAVAPGR